MEDRSEALVLGIGNVLWADEGFGVRAVEALHATYAFPAAVSEGRRNARPQPLRCRRHIAARAGVRRDRLRREPGALIVLRDAEVPAWGRTKLSPHQNGFNDVLALAQLNGRAPETIVAVGVQPQELPDFGGSLTEPSGNAFPTPWRSPPRAGTLGISGAAGRRSPFPAAERAILARLDAYESGRPSAAEACRGGDPRVLARGDGSADMCVGIPMQVMSSAETGADCEGRGRRERIDVRWSAINGRHLDSRLPGPAVRALTEEAAQTDAALDALEAALAGDSISTPTSRISSVASRSCRRTQRRDPMTFPVPTAAAARAARIR